jgi:hypothetical protein
MTTALTAYLQGQGVVSSDQLNTFEQTTDLATDLRSFTGVSGLEVAVRGTSTVGDGGAGDFYWNATSQATDNGQSVIQPSGQVTGRWIRLGYYSPTPQANNVSAYSYQTPLTGFTITIPNGVGSLILNPAGTLATGQITLPLPTVDGWIVRISSSQTITTLTVVTQAGYGLSNAPTTLSAGSPIGFQAVATAASPTWFRI